MNKNTNTQIQTEGLYFIDSEKNKTSADLSLEPDAEAVVFYAISVLCTRSLTRRCGLL